MSAAQLALTLSLQSLSIVSSKCQSSSGPVHFVLHLAIWHLMGRGIISHLHDMTL